MSYEQMGQKFSAATVIVMAEKMNELLICNLF